jgi:hypothetical protein
MRRRIAIARWALLVVAGGLACGPRQRLALEPIPPMDDDRYDIPAPRERVRDDYYDQVDYTIFEQFAQAADMPRNLRKVAGKPKQALNATPLDEVRDSSWFTNRIGRRRLSAAEVRQGANRPLGPDLEQELVIVAGKSQGVTPGFTIQDARGDRYVIKPDPKLHPELATGADMIATRLFWALGYNVSEDYLVRLRPEQLRIGPKATVKLELGKRRPFTQQDLDIVLSKVAREPDGSIRVVASRFLAGKPLGPIPFLGLRKDDPNDVIRHEHRRELRGYKMFCAWLNHNDSREINSLDMYVEEDGRKFVKHYVIDLNATLGSASIFPNLRSEGYEYIFDLGEMGKSLATLGLYERPWEDLEFPRRRGIGNFEATRFQPYEWKPNYPCPPFENATARDNFWAAKLVVRFDDALLRAAVDAAEFTDPAAADYMVRTLAERRDRIGRHCFTRVNPLDEFEIVQAPSAAGGGALAGKVLAGALGGWPASPRALRFADLAVRHGFVAPRRYDVLVRGPGGRRLAQFVTDTNEIPLEDAVAALGTPAAGDTESRLLVLTIHSGVGVNWSPSVDVTVYLHPSGALRVAGIARDE